MKRLVFEELKRWKESPQRKPILLRGARQVGKTYIVRELGKLCSNFVEINFELLPDASKIFERDLLPDRIIRDLSLFLARKIEPGQTLLFFDEIQASPKAIQAMRYFFELLPQLHLISAGSLLDFELEKIGMPVGRVTSIYMYPLSFVEFLSVKGEMLLIESILEHDIKTKLSEIVHNKLLHILGEYFAIGGMPETVQCWLDTQVLINVGRFIGLLSIRSDRISINMRPNIKSNILNCCLTPSPLFWDKNLNSAMSLASIESGN